MPVPRSDQKDRVSPHHSSDGVIGAIETVAEDGKTIQHFDQHIEQSITGQAAGFPRSPCKFQLQTVPSILRVLETEVVFIFLVPSKLDEHGDANRRYVRDFDTVHAIERNTKPVT